MIIYPLDQQTRKRLQKFSSLSFTTWSIQGILASPARGGRGSYEPWQ